MTVVISNHSPIQMNIPSDMKDTHLSATIGMNREKNTDIVPLANLLYTLLIRSTLYAYDYLAFDVFLTLIQTFTHQTSVLTPFSTVRVDNPNIPC